METILKQTQGCLIEKTFPHIQLINKFLNKTVKSTIAAFFPTAIYAIIKQRCLNVTVLDFNFVIFESNGLLK